MKLAFIAYKSNLRKRSIGKDVHFAENEEHFFFFKQDVLKPGDNMDIPSVAGQKRAASEELDGSEPRNRRVFHGRAEPATPGKLTPFQLPENAIVIDLEEDDDDTTANSPCATIKTEGEGAQDGGGTPVGIAERDNERSKAYAELRKANNAVEMGRSKHAKAMGKQVTALRNQVEAMDEMSAAKDEENGGLLAGKVAEIALKDLEIAEKDEEIVDNRLEIARLNEKVNEG